MKFWGNENEMLLKLNILLEAVFLEKDLFLFDVGFSF